MEENRDSKDKMEVTGKLGKYERKDSGNSIEPLPEINNSKSPKKIAMKPLLSWRSIVILSIGLIVGIVIAFAYWLYSPALIGDASSNPTDNATTGLLGILGMVPDGPYESRVNIQVVSPGSEYTPLLTLQQRAEYYSAKSLSLPFFEFLSQKLSQQMPDFSANVDNLAKSISSSYNARTEIPVIRITVTAPTEKQAATLAELVPQNFSAYLIAEEKEKLEKDYIATLAAIDTVKAALYEAQAELNTLKQNNVATINPDIIILKAKVDAFQLILNNQVTQISVQTVGDLQLEYDNTLKQLNLVNAQAAEAKLQMEALQKSYNISNNITDDSYRTVLEAKVRALQAELDRSMATIVTVTTDNLSLAYTNALQSVDLTAKALSDARKELSDIQAKSAQISLVPTSLDYQILQIKIATFTTQQTALSTKLTQLYQQIMNAEEKTGENNIESQFGKTSLALTQAKKDLEDFENKLGYDRLSSDLNISIAQNKVNNLNTRLTTLTGNLGSLVGGNINSLETDYLVASNPSAPFPVLPTRAKARNTLMAGALVGIFIAWALWNTKWIINKLKTMGSSPEIESVEKE
jgi:hypothetical protein